MALFDSPDSFRKLGLIGGGLMLAATGNPLGMILPNLYAAQMESGQRRRSAGKANDYLTSPEYVYEDPATGNGQGGLVTKKQALSSEVFNGWGGQSYSAPTQEQRMDAARPMLAQADPEAFQAAATQAAARQMFEPKAVGNVREVFRKDGKSLFVSDEGLLQLQQRDPDGGWTFEKPTKDFKKGETREVKRGNQIVTETYDGNGWSQYATAPAFKPEDGKPVPSKFAFDRQAGINRSVTDQEINDNPSNFAPPVSDATNDKAKDAQTKLQVLDDALNNYETLYDKYGTETGGAKSSELESAYRIVQVQAKELFDLGALQPADMSLIEGVLSNPTGLMATSGGLARGVGNFVGIKTGDPYKAQIGQVRNLINTKRKVMSGNNPAMGDGVGRGGRAPTAAEIEAEIQRRGLGRPQG